jgi:hypothetical protein
MYWSVALLSAVGAYGSGGQFVLEGEPGLLGSLCRPQSACAPLALRRPVSVARSAPDSVDLRAP